MGRIYIYIYFIAIVSFSTPNGSILTGDDKECRMESQQFAKVVE